MVGPSVDWVTLSFQRARRRKSTTRSVVACGCSSVIQCPAIRDDRIFGVIGDAPYHLADQRAECSFAAEGQDRHLKLALRKERPVVGRILAERQELGKARAHKASMSASRRRATPPRTRKDTCPRAAVRPACPRSPRASVPWHCRATRHASRPGGPG
jgi:hypothetical protein